jgi:hypothetical protein
MTKSSILVRASWVDSSDVQLTKSARLFRDPYHHCISGGRHTLCGLFSGLASHLEHGGLNFG